MRRYIIALAFGAALLSPAARADDFTAGDVDRWQSEFDSAAKKGRQLWTSGAVGTNGVACAQCHPNAANTHPETYPKFQKQLGKVAQLFEMVNWCIKNPLQGTALPADDPKMTAFIAYIHKERKGVAIDAGKH